MADVIRPSNEHSDWARQGMQMIQDAATKPLHADIEHLMLALVQQETVLNECEALLKETISEDGVCADFDSRLAAYWERSKALADWRTRDMLIAQRPRNETGEPLACEGCGTMGNGTKRCCPDQHLVSAQEVIRQLWDLAYPPRGIPAHAQKASEPRVAYNSNGDAYLVETPASSEPEQR